MAILDGGSPQANALTAPAVGILGDPLPDANITALAASSQMAGNSSVILQLFYPEGSVNPESQPQGGADFYATPLDISKANNVTLEYSVFFPADFDWVRAGKLPGLYGGHRSCSGGDDAKSCFSTRLMWREDGAGELYLVSANCCTLDVRHSYAYYTDSTLRRTSKPTHCALRLRFPFAIKHMGCPSPAARSILLLEHGPKLGRLWL